MLTPILAVKTATPSPTPVQTRDASTKESSVQKQPALSGQRSEAALRILEALNRHLVGADIRPKEALARLLDTLSRLLKIEPVPQESLRDFGKRIATVIEALPPQARLSLEKQLGQRNLALSVRILADIVKTLPLPEAVNRPQATTGAPRPAAEQGQSGPSRAMSPLLPVASSAQPPRAAPIASAVVPAASFPSTHSGFGVGGLDAATLQAALRSAFSLDEEIPKSGKARASLEEDDGQPGLHETTTTAERTSLTTSPLRQAFSGEAIPTLHAVVRFLAGDPETLTQVIAIADGDMDEDVYGAVKQALEMDRPVATAFDSEGVPGGRASLTENLPGSATPAEVEESEVDVAAGGRPSEAGAEGDISYNPGNDMPELGEDAPAFDLRREGDDLHTQTSVVREKAEQTILSRAEIFAARTISDALQTLIDTGVPLSSDTLSEPLETVLAGFTVPEEADGERFVSSKPPTIAAQRENNISAEDLPLAQEISGESDAADREAARIANRAAIADDLQQETLSQKISETIVLRESISFLAMPVAIRNDDRRRLTEDQDQPREFDDKGQEQASGEGDENGEDADEFAGQNAAPDEEQSVEDEATDAYALYRRLGDLS